MNDDHDYTKAEPKCKCGHVKNLHEECDCPKCDGQHCILCICDEFRPRKVKRAK